MTNPSGALHARPPRSRVWAPAVLWPLLTIEVDGDGRRPSITASFGLGASVRRRTDRARHGPGTREKRSDAGSASSPWGATHEQLDRNSNRAAISEKLGPRGSRGSGDPSSSQGRSQIVATVAEIARRDARLKPSRATRSANQRLHLFSANPNRWGPKAHPRLDRQVLKAADLPRPNAGRRGLLRRRGPRQEATIGISGGRRPAPGRAVGTGMNDTTIYPAPTTLAWNVYGAA